jgi:DNA-directed RNA polymerase subunit RPC12/RpoP
MRCIKCGSTAVSERSERTVQGYRRFRCRACGKQFNERSESLLNRTQYPSDVIALDAEPGLARHRTASGTSMCNVPWWLAVARKPHRCSDAHQRSSPVRVAFGLEGSGELFRLGKPETEVGQASLPIALEACNLHLRRRAERTQMELRRF